MRDTTLITAGLFAALTLVAHAEPAPGAVGVAARQDGWLSWRVPIADGDRVQCCFGDWHKGVNPKQGCELDSKGYQPRNFGSFDGPGELPAARELVIYARAERGVIDQVFAVGDTCPVKHGVKVRTLEVSNGESLAVLDQVARRGERRDASDALSAIAQHQGATATRVLEMLSTPDLPRRLREDALFWLGHSRGAEGLAAVTRIARDDADDEVRARALFAMSQSREPGRLAAIEQVLRGERDADVRREGYFAVSQTRLPGARAILEQAARTERERDAISGAVFGLSQLPDGAGVDAMIALAKRSDLEPKVRREALFWLGESKDPRATAALDEILTR
jgi:hypothetical protein